MQIDPEECRRYYAFLSDEALLALDREALVDVAKQYYDQELAQRGLFREGDAIQGEVQGIDEELVPIAIFLYPDEAKLARALLQSSAIFCSLENEHTLSAMWTWSFALGEFRLMVPASFAEQAQEILNSTLTEQELGAEPATPENSTDEAEIIAAADERWTRRLRVWLVITLALFGVWSDVPQLFYIW